MTRIITYSLRLDGRKSDDYYRTIAAFADDWLADVLGDSGVIRAIGAFRDFWRARGEAAANRSDAEYALELLALGVMLHEHGGEAARGAAQGEPGFPAVRAGLHLGPCVERTDDYIGATVNLAARVTAFARSGQVLCTEPVAEAIRNLNIAALQPAGAERFRNVSQLMTLFELHDPHRPLVSGDFDPVCRMRLDPERAPARLPYGDRVYHFCSFNCAQKFARTPEAYALT